MDYYRRWVGDYLRDTLELSIVEDGAYNRLLDAYYASDGRLTSDLDALCRIVRAFDPTERAAVAKVLRRYFTVDGEALRHARCDAELEHGRAAIAAGRKGAMARWAVAPDDTTVSKEDATALRPQSDGNATAMPSKLQPPDSNPKSKNKTLRGARKPQATGVEHEALSDYRRDFALSRVPDMDTAETWQAFADHHAKLANRFADWDAAWRTWVRNIADKGYPYAKGRVSANRALSGDVPKFDHTGAPMVPAQETITTVSPEQAAANVKRLRDAITRGMHPSQSIRQPAVSAGIQRSVDTPASAPDADAGSGAESSGLPF